MKTMFKTVKLRLYPNEAQKQMIENTFGACRFLYNEYINYRMRLYATTGTGIGAYAFMTEHYVPMKNSDYQWLKETSSAAHEHAIIEAESAYNRFFKNMISNNKRRIAAGKKPINSPRLKSKKNPVHSYYVSSFGVRFKPSKTDNRLLLKLPKLGKHIRYRGKIPPYIKIHDSRISRQYNDYYLLLRVTVECPPRERSNPLMIGIDFGVFNFATVCFHNYITGETNYRIYDIVDARAKRVQLRIHNLSHVISTKYARNLERGIENPGATKNIEKLNYKIRNARKKFYAIRLENIRKFINDIVKMNPVSITIEDLAVSSMMMKKRGDNLRKYRNKLMANCLSTVRQLLQFKAFELSIPVHIADRFYPSSQICSSCGVRNRDITWGVRTFKCKKCGYTCDRDINAARNLATTRTFIIHNTFPVNLRGNRGL